MPTDLTNDLRCLGDDGYETCRGPVEYRVPLSGSGRSFPRCELHWEERLAEQERIQDLYAPDSDVPPPGFDPADAGERWEESY